VKDDDSQAAAAGATEQPANGDETHKVH